ncbi:MAG: indolepyruvate oxidoreductase subunit beta [Clostridiales bacterium]|nr:indolepyruvate oxidoreductase subunit beta [Clostridiales bacterium]
MAKDISIVLAGVGGQGTLIAGKLLGILALKLGWDIKVSEVHGMSQRGGSVITYVRMGEKVYSPIIEEGMADYVLSFEEVEAVRWANLLKKDGVLLVNSQKIKSLPVLLGNAEYPENILDSLKGADQSQAKIVEFDALSAALECGSSKAVNMVMVGALSAGMDIDKALWEEAINEAFASKAKLIPMNLQAFNKGREFFG